MTRRKAILALLVGVVFLTSAADDPEEVAFQEYHVKAAFLYNFAKFTMWPSHSFPNAKAPVRIGVLGQNPFGTLLEDTVRGKLIHGRSLVVVPKAFGDDLTDCHLLFISRSEKDHLPAIFSALRGRPVLTISEIDRFANNGGMIRLMVVDRSIRFEINVDAIEAAGLKVSATLGSLGKIVRSEPARR